MIVFKFGGTSVGKANHIRNIVDIIKEEKGVVVLSAVAGTTNAFERILAHIVSENTKAIEEEFIQVRQKFSKLISDLIPQQVGNYGIYYELNLLFDSLYSQLISNSKPIDPQFLLAQGEIITSKLFIKYLESKNIKAQLIPALNFMRCDKDGEPDYFYIKEGIEKAISKNKTTDLFITQGYICKDYNGNISNLGRGGSDYTATIIASVIHAKEVQIWSDIDGMHNNDPRFVDNTFSVKQLDYREAEELAYFGAKVLHPKCIRPVEKLQIPILLKDTTNRFEVGTIISNSTSGFGIKAIAARDHITAIKIKSGRMLMAHGFLKKVFEVFDDLETPVDLITTSEITISLTIDETHQITEIEKRLSKLGDVEIYQNQSIVSLVGDVGTENKGLLYEIGKGLKDIAVRMVSYGASNNNLSLLIATENKATALKSLNHSIFSQYA